ncbi:MAG: transposase [Oscillospiraceae bacterium]
MTAYLWGAQQGLLTRKSIYNFIRTYHLGEFQKLPSYQAFCRRLNRLAAAFAALAEVLFEQKLASSEPTHGYVLDSCPVMVSVGSRSNTAKTARNLCNLTRNPTKNLWYHGVKLHVFAQLRPHQLPIPCAVQISKASLCDLWAAKQIDLDCAPVTDGRLYADRAYIDAEWRSHLQTERNVALITPRKRKKYDVLVSEDAVSTRISARHRGLFQLAAGQNAHPVCFARPFLRRSALPHLLLPRFRRPPLAVQLSIRIYEGKLSPQGD